MPIRQALPELGAPFRSLGSNRSASTPSHPSKGPGGALVPEALVASINHQASRTPPSKHGHPLPDPCLRGGPTLRMDARPHTRGGLE